MIHKREQKPVDGSGEMWQLGLVNRKEQRGRHLIGFHRAPHTFLVEIVTIANYLNTWLWSTSQLRVTSGNR